MIQKPELSSVADWYKAADVNNNLKAAWMDNRQHGFYIYAWNNPQPKKIVSHIDIVSAENKTVGIVLGITALTE